MMPGIPPKMTGPSCMRDIVHVVLSLDTEPLMWCAHTDIDDGRRGRGTMGDNGRERPLFFSTGVGIVSSLVTLATDTFVPSLLVVGRNLVYWPQMLVGAV